MKKTIYLYPPKIQKSFLSYIKKCIKDSMVSTAGDMVVKFEDMISKYTRSKHAVAFNSGTSALEIAIKAVGIEPNTEILVPTLTFVATINSVVNNNCIPIFMDCDDYYNLDVDKVKKFLLKNTYRKKNQCINKISHKRISAVVITHVWGNAANVNKLKKICKVNQIKIIEDASESLGTFYNDNKNKHTGTVGDVGVISFNANKIITTGGGGMLLTNSKKIALNAKHLSTQAKKDSVFFIHDDVGNNSRMTNISAALGISQFKNLKKIIFQKTKIRSQYKKKLKEISDITLAETPSYSKNNNWMNVIKSKKKIQLKKMVNKFYENKIQVRPVWKLNHLQKPFKSYQKFNITKAKYLYERSLCLPSFPHLSEKEISLIVDVFNEK